MKLPLFCIHLFGTTWIWIFVPVIFFTILLLPLTIWLQINFPNDFLPLILFFPGSLLAVLGLIILVPWHFGWCFTCLGIMFGRGRMAKIKYRELHRRLKKLHNQKTRHPE